MMFIAGTAPGKTPGHRIAVEPLSASISPSLREGIPPPQDNHEGKIDKAGINQSPFPP